MSDVLHPRRTSGVTQVKNILVGTVVSLAAAQASAVSLGTISAKIWRGEIHEDTVEGEAYTQEAAHSLTHSTQAQKVTCRSSKAPNSEVFLYLYSVPHRDPPRPSVNT